MGFLQGKTAIITGGGRAVLERRTRAAPSAMALRRHTPRRARIW